MDSIKFPALFVLSGLCVSTLGASAKETKPAGPQAWAIRDNPALGGEEKLNRLIALLRKAMDEPPGTAMGMESGEITVTSNVPLILRVIANGNLNPYFPLWKQSLEKRLKIETDQSLRSRIALVLGMMGEHSVIPELIDLLESDSDATIRGMTAHALGELRDPHGIGALRRALANDKSASVRFESNQPVAYSPVRQAAAEALKKMGIPVAKDAALLPKERAVATLESFLNQDPATSRMAARQLRTVGCPQAQAALARFIDKKTKARQFDNALAEAKMQLEYLAQ